MTSVTIGESVTSIGEHAFYGCTGLTSVTIPNSVTSIGKSAFSGCSGMTSVKWYVKSCSDFSFYYDSSTSPFSGCTNISSFEFGDQVEKIPAHLCNGLSGLTSVSIGNSVTSIGSYAFLGCSGLTSVTIPNSVTSIGTCAFSGCSGLASVNILNSDTSIGSNAFYGTAWYNNQSDGLIYIGSVAYMYKGTMPSGTAITIKSGTKGIAGRCFFGCSGLTSVTIPNSVTSIGEYAFYGCTGLTSVTIPNSVTSIGDLAFFGCAGLTSVTIGESVTSIGREAFYNCSSLTSVTIPNSVTYIGNEAFAQCSGLTSITIPNSVTEIGELVFFGCSGLASVTIPNSVTSIGERAFKNCSGLMSVTIPSSVTSIGGGAFKNCSGLMSVTIPSSVTSIGESAFSDCSSLTSVTLPSSVTSIGSYAFSGCVGLTRIDSYLVPSRITLGNSVFKNVTTSTCVLHVPSRCLSCYQSASQWEVFTNIVDDLILTLPLSNEEYLLYNVNSDGSSVMLIKDDAYKLFTGSLDIPSEMTLNGQTYFVTSIEDEAFSGCSGLRSVTIGESVSSIGNYAFQNCAVLAEINSYPDAAKVTMGDKVFDGVPQNTCIVHVLPEYLETYKSTAQWINFPNIIGDLKGIAHIPAAVATEASEVKSRSFVANWESVDGAASYDLYVFDNSGEEPTLLEDYPVNTEDGFYEVTGLQPNTRYSYYVVSKDEEGNESPKSNEIEVTTLDRISAPVGLEATDIASASFVANWEAVDGAESYDLYVGFLVEGEESATASSTFSDKNLTVGGGELAWATTAAAYGFDSGTYARGAQWSRISPTLTATIDGARAITKVTVVASTNDDNATVAVTVGGTAYGAAQHIASGTDNCNREYAFTGDASGEIAVSLTNSKSVWVKSIAVEYIVPTGETALELLEGYPVNTEDGFYEVTGLEPDTTYSFYVVARDYSDIEGEQSEIVSVTTANASHGDLNGDGSVDGGDVSILLEMVLAGGVTDAQKAVADLNGDGDVDGGDVSILLEMVLSGN